MGDASLARSLAFQQRDEGTVVHPTEDGNYTAEFARQWGGPEAPRFHAQAIKLWSAEHGSAQRGRRALVTGGTGGLGFFAAKILAAVGMVVILPSRPNLEHEAHGAAAAIRAAIPNARVEVPEVPLDLRSFESVRRFGAALRGGPGALDVLCLNAGRGGSSHDKLERTADGHEVIMQVNLLGHVLLVHELLPMLRRSSYARIVAHTGMARSNAREGMADDLSGSSYMSTPFQQYAISKAALCLYVRGLNEQLGALGLHGAAVLADPGLAATGINFQHDIVRTLGLSRHGLADTRAYHDAYAAHAADASLPLAMAALVGEVGEVWVGESSSPRGTSLDAAAHRLGHLLWPPPRRTDPILWADEAVAKLWKKLAELVDKEGSKEGSTDAGAATSDTATGTARSKAEL